MKNLLKNIPSLPGVYLFKDENDQTLYIGKAKNLKLRTASYVKKHPADLKTSALLEHTKKIDHIVTKNELEAILLEAVLIQSNKPKFNISLKAGQPFLYINISSSPRKLPELKIVRNKKENGVYFGPFLEKTPARKVFCFLQKTFKLKLCKKKIESGCLDYHLGTCAGSCRHDFDKQSYLERLNLAKLALKKGHKKFLKYLSNQIEKCNQNLEFEKSKELYHYCQAFQQVFQTIDTTNEYKTKSLTRKDIWILTESKKALFLFSELSGAIKKKHASFYLFHKHPDHLDYFKSYYRSFSCPPTILINFAFEQKDKKLFETFLQKWHTPSPLNVSIINPVKGHFYNLIRLAQLHAQEELKKQTTLPKALKRLLKLQTEPHTIDCFDVSHKHGMFMVGSCIRFKAGKPDKENFRRFKIKTVKNQDDYACLQEIVNRRYKDRSQIPDLILIDGGKGQLNAITSVVPEACAISLAKREERVFSKNLPEGKKLNLQNYAAQILIALRDYAHHFAISYHRKLTKI